MFAYNALPPLPTQPPPPPPPPPLPSHPPLPPIPPLPASSYKLKHFIDKKSFQEELHLLQARYPNLTRGRAASHPQCNFPTDQHIYATDPQKTLYEAVCHAWNRLNLDFHDDACLWTMTNDLQHLDLSHFGTRAKDVKTTSFAEPFACPYISSLSDTAENRIKSWVSEDVSCQDTSENTDSERDLELDNSDELFTNSSEMKISQKFYALPHIAHYKQRSLSTLRASARYICHDSVLSDQFIMRI